MSDLFGIRHAYREASENILVAETHEGIIRSKRLDDARDCIARGFCPEAPFGRGEEWLVRAVADAIMDSWSLNERIVGPGTQARRIVNELFKHLKPEGV